MVWENYRDERSLSGTTYVIRAGSTAAGKLTAAPMDIWIRGQVQGQWTDATVVSVTVTEGQRAPSQLLLPYAHGQTWWVCQGYNGAPSHSGIAALDLTVRQQDVSTNGCWGDVNASANRPVKAPGTGTAFLSGPDGVCLNLDSGKSMWIGHLTQRTEGQILRGGQLGITAPADVNLNGGYAHIHVQVHPGSGCAASGPPIPFDDAHGTRFTGAADMPYTGAVNEYSGVGLTRT
jgi:hypothetical protein